MRLEVKVKFGSKVNIELDENKAIAVLTDPPEKGKANKQLIGLLSDHFRVPKSKISIISGLKSRNKIVEIS